MDVQKTNEAIIQDTDETINSSHKLDAHNKDYRNDLRRNKLENSDNWHLDVNRAMGETRRYIHQWVDHMT